MLKASSVWDDALSNLARDAKMLRVEVEEERWCELRTLAMAAE